MKRITLLAGFALLAFSFSTVSAQQPEAPQRQIVLEDTTPYSVAPKLPSAAVLRQQIALEKGNQRRARMEYNAWRGHQPLRPVATAAPMMRSNYVRPYYVPYFAPYYISAAAPAIR